MLLYELINEKIQEVVMDIVMTGDPGVVADTKTVVKVQRPTMYKVVFLNDDFTPMNFVVKILEEVFFRDYEESLAIMLEVHHNGRGIAGVYSKEIAETKVEETNEIAALNGYPLKVIAEPDEQNNSGNDAD